MHRVAEGSRPRQFGGGIRLRNRRLPRLPHHGVTVCRGMLSDKEPFGRGNRFALRRDQHGLPGIGGLQPFHTVLSRYRMFTGLERVMHFKPEIGWLSGARAFGHH